MSIVNVTLLTTLLECLICATFSIAFKDWPNFMLFDRPSVPLSVSSVPLVAYFTINDSFRFGLKKTTNKILRILFLFEKIICTFFYTPSPLSP